MLKRKKLYSLVFVVALLMACGFRIHQAYQTGRVTQVVARFHYAVKLEPARGLRALLKHTAGPVWNSLSINELQFDRLTELEVPMNAELGRDSFAPLKDMIFLRSLKVDQPVNSLQLHQIARCRSLRSLELQSLPFDAHLPVMKQVETLILSDANLSPANWNALGQFVSLRVLNLNGAEPLFLDELSSTNLHSLRLVVPSNKELYLQVAALSTLKRLDITFSGKESLDLGAMHPLASLGLQSLEVYCSSFSTDDFIRVADTTEVRNLYFCSISVEQVHEVLSRRPQLQIATTFFPQSGGM